MEEWGPEIQETLYRHIKIKYRCGKVLPYVGVIKETVQFGHCATGSIPARKKVGNRIIRAAYMVILDVHVILRL
jgi:hypothetical protein